eukprot:scaffold19191_cov134-Isochrysis_galbana.AAC.14
MRGQRRWRAAALLRVSVADSGGGGCGGVWARRYGGEKAYCITPRHPPPHSRPKSVQGRVACFAPEKAYP